MQSLVVYYSFEGNTKFIAKTIQETISCDILELKPEKEIKTHSFMKFFWGGKQVLMKEKPALQKYNDQFENYDLIFIGTPVWSFTFTPPLRTFFSKTSLQNKKIALFCCHEGGMRKTLENMEKELIINNNQVVGKKDFKNVLQNKEACREKVKNWINELKLH